MALDYWKAEERAKRLRLFRDRLHKINSQRAEEAKRIKDATPGVTEAVDVVKKLKSND
jgi:hypothetical protein